MSSKLEPAIWSCDTGEQIPRFDRCQLIKTWMSNIKDVCCKLAWYWSHWHTWRGGRTYVRMYLRMVDDVMTIIPKFLASMGYHIFLTMVLCAPPLAFGVRGEFDNSKSETFTSWGVANEKGNVEASIASVRILIYSF